MGLFIWFGMLLWNIMSALFGAVRQAKVDSESWNGDEGEISVVDLSPMKRVLENPDNEWAWAEGIVTSLAYTGARAVYKATVKNGVAEVADEQLNL